MAHEFVPAEITALVGDADPLDHVLGVDRVVWYDRSVKREVREEE
jgi:hypothetical protein